MGRNKIISDEALLAHARDEFLENGALGSTRQIAHRARISESTIFKRYPTKEKLYMAAMIPTDIEDNNIVADEISDTKQALVETGIRLLNYFRQVVPTTMNLISNPLINKDQVMEHFGHKRRQKIANDLTAFISKRAEAGALKTQAPLASAQFLIASIHSLAVYEMMGLHDNENFEHAIPHFINELWNGLQPHQQGKNYGL